MSVVMQRAVVAVAAPLAGPTHAPSSSTSVRPAASTHNVSTLMFGRTRAAVLCRANNAILEPASANADDDSVVPEVAALPEAGDTDGVESRRKAGPLAKGGTLSGKSAAGKDAGAAALGAASGSSSMLDDNGRFVEPRWVNGNWDFAQFTGPDGKTDWDAVIDAEAIRRQVLENSPIASTNEDPVFFETGMVPWWAWVRRFHLPEAEQLNGRAAMVGFVWALWWERTSGQSLASQMDSFGGKFFLIATLLGVLFIRRNADAKTILDLAEEWTFYDKQWQATWKQGDTVESEKSE